MMSCVQHHYNQIQPILYLGKLNIIVRSSCELRRPKCNSRFLRTNLKYTPIFICKRKVIAFLQILPEIPMLQHTPNLQPTRKPHWLSSSAPATPLIPICLGSWDLQEQVCICSMTNTMIAVPPAAPGAIPVNILEFFPFHFWFDAC